MSNKNSRPVIHKKLENVCYPELLISSITYKDFDLIKLLMSRPDLEPIFSEIISAIKTKKKHITVDYKEFFPVVDLPSRTCQDTSWHTDGKDNEYYLACFGLNGTEFLTSSSDIIPKSDLKLQNQLTNAMVNSSQKTLNSFKAKNGVLYKYDSMTIHRGHEVLVETFDEAVSNSRILIRICCSDYITPKNYIKK